MQIDRIKKILSKRVVILDGAMGTQLYQRGMPSGVSPELWALKNPQVVRAIHADYEKAGADIVLACTFGANRMKLGEYGERNVFAVNRKLTKLARSATSGKALVAADIGPIGTFVAPFGPLAFEEAVGIFKEQVKGLLEGGVDLFVIETMMDIQEARAALIAVKELSNAFTIVTMTYEKGGTTLNGTDAVTALITLQSLGADAVGCNCSTGPKEMIALIKSMKPKATVPLVAKPNAGMPRLSKGMTTFDMEPNEFASYAKPLVRAGVNFLGGCCGTTPQHIKVLKDTAGGLRPLPPKRKAISALSSARAHVVLENNKTTVVVGECINPTGKKSLQEELRKGKMTLVRRLAHAQQSAGAKLLDVNAGAAGVDEGKTLEKIIEVLTLSTELPLVIDSSKIEAVERALRFYPGRALINSLSAEKNKMENLLPVAAKYGAMFILLPLNDKEIPQEFRARRKVIEQVLRRARSFGFQKNDIVVDGLVLTISSYPQAAVQTMKTVRWASRELKVNTICGLSNISFGMPQRVLINSTYLSLLKKAGLSMVISNPLHKKVRYNKAAERVLLGKDKNARAYIDYCRGLKDTKQGTIAKEKKMEAMDAKEKIFNAITKGDRDDIKVYIQEAVNLKIKPEFLVHKIMIPAINKVGELFDRKEYFLPQLIASAEAMKLAFEVLKPYLKNLKGGATGKSAAYRKNVIILATVKGDIHDIGKNIVSLMLQNHGFAVIDLGKDVSSQKIISEVRRHKAHMVGLSALMTTTMVNMKEVIAAAKKEKLNCRFIVGGAVITKSFAHSIGAAYAKDGVEAVRLAQRLSR